MARLSINQAWNETAEFVKRDFGPLFAIALALIALPNFALQALAPVDPGAADGAGMGLWLLLLVVALLSSLVGTLAITTLALGRENVVGSAIGHSFRRLPPVLAAVLLVGVAAIAAIVILSLLLHITPEALAAPNRETLGRVTLLLLLVTIVMLPFWVKLMLMTPVASAEPAGALAIIKRSWVLTRGHFWKLLGFTLLLVLVLLVVLVVVGALAGILLTLLLGPPEAGNLSELLLLLVRGAINAAFSVVFTTMVARVYAQLAGPAPAGSASGGIASGGTSGS
jgi:hypothetical protein